MYKNYKIEKIQITIDYLPQSNNFNYLIDPIFTNVSRLYVLWFTRNNAGDNRDSFSHYFCTKQ